MRKHNRTDNAMYVVAFYLLLTVTHDAVGFSVSRLRLHYGHAQAGHQLYQEGEDAEPSSGPLRRDSLVGLSLELQPVASVALPRCSGESTAQPATAARFELSYKSLCVPIRAAVQPLAFASTAGRQSIFSARSRAFIGICVANVD